MWLSTFKDVVRVRVRMWDIIRSILVVVSVCSFGFCSSPQQSFQTGSRARVRSRFFRSTPSCTCQVESCEVGKDQLRDSLFLSLFSDKVIESHPAFKKFSNFIYGMSFKRIRKKCYYGQKYDIICIDCRNLPQSQFNASQDSSFEDLNMGHTDISFVCIDCVNLKRQRQGLSESLTHDVKKSFTCQLHPVRQLNYRNGSYQRSRKRSLLPSQQKNIRPNLRKSLRDSYLSFRITCFFGEIPLRSKRSVRIRRTVKRDGVPGKEGRSSSPDKNISDLESYHSNVSSTVSTPTREGKVKSNEGQVTAVMPQPKVSQTTPITYHLLHEINQTEYKLLMEQEEMSRRLKRESQWAYVCLVFIISLILFAIWSMRGFHSRIAKKREIRHDDNDHYLTVKEVLYRRAHYLPMFNKDLAFEEVYVHDCGTNP